MNIKYVANVMLPAPRAHGYQIMKTCQALQAQGAAVELLVTNRVAPYFDQEPFAYYEIPHNAFRLIRLPVIDAILMVPNWFEKIASYLERATFIQSVKKFLPFFSPKDVIFVRDAYLAAHLISQKKSPLFLEFHDLPKMNVMQNLSKVSGFVCLTNWLATECQRMHPNIPTIVIPDAVDIDRFNPTLTRQEARKALGIDPEEKVIVYGGAFTTVGKSKGLSFLDRAVFSLLEKHQKIHLYLVGGSTEEYTLVEEGKNPSRTTTCIPFAKQKELAQYYRAADVLVMPFPNTHHYAYEMSPLKMFEYMASGTTIVTSDLPSVRDVLDETSAVFFEAGNGEQLSSAISHLLEMTEPERNAFGKKAQDIAKEKYTWNARAKRLMGFFGGAM